MSYDLQVWSVRRPSLQSLPNPEKWVSQDGVLTYSTRTWQVAVSDADRVLPEDIPAEVAPLLPGIGFLTELNLSPINAGQVAQQTLTKAATHIAKQSHGIVMDPQLGIVRLPSGVKRLSPLGSAEAASLLTMSWWFTEGPLAKRDLETIIDLLLVTMPEALPRRYGLREPPQHVLSETGLTHFKQFIRDNDSVVWYPSSPVAHVHFAVPQRIGASRRGFRSGVLEIEVDADALRQPGWHDAVQLVWKQISKSVQPFYGDVRTSHGWVRERGRYWSGPAAIGHHPVVSWWWPGIPRGPVHAVVLGRPYLDLWQTFREVAEELGDLKALSTTDWCSEADALTTIGQAPGEIAQRSRVPYGDQQYPPVWPFEPPIMAE